ncbi:MAG: hypothetical protein J5821_01360 [Alphaproteobacteria bacterium]|nr:hypothetical protein [Alphaproteobacteria bacterium]
MKKIISTVAMACLSFSCFAEDYFVKIATDEYVLVHPKTIEKTSSLPKYTDASYTPTHVFTYADGNPNYFSRIRKIEYIKSNVTFVKDIKSRKCCIDIYDGSNPNKCRIIGVDGRIIISNSEYKRPRSFNFEVYEVEGEADSFIDNKQRLIYVDRTGLYIVEKNKNTVEDILPNYDQNETFNFKGEIIKISAIDGKREMSGFDENQKEIFAFNCPSDAPVSFEVEATPVMKQIEKITGVKLVTPPPSEEAALQRMAEILDVPTELLVFDNGMVKRINKVKILGRNIFTNNPLTNKLKGIIGVSPKKSAITNAMFEKVCDYKFDTSDEAKKRRKEIALKPWDE